jgi:hypothetical protein
MKLLFLRLWIVLALLSLLMSMIVPATLARAQGSGDFIPNEVIVKLSQATDVAGIAAAHNLDPTPLDQFGSRPIFRMRILDGVSPLDRAEFHRTITAGNAARLGAER